MNILERLKQNSRYIQVIDIGCGQGEIVSKLEGVGISAIGFDPTLRQTSSNLIKHYYSAESLRANDLHNSNALHIFVLRCVLPHINNPLEFLNDIFNEFPASKIYLEFQNLDIILKSKAWYSFMHDHVNYFTIDSFRSYNIIDSGNFGEWSWVCLGARSLQAAECDSFAKDPRNFMSNSSSADKSRGGDWMAMLAEAESVIEQQQQSLNDKTAAFQKNVNEVEQQKEHLNKQLEAVNVKRAELEKHQEEHVKRLEKVANLSAES